MHSFRHSTTAQHTTSSYVPFRESLFGCMVSVCWFSHIFILHFLKKTLIHLLYFLYSFQTGKRIRQRLRKTSKVDDKDWVKSSLSIEWSTHFIKAKSCWKSLYEVDRIMQICIQYLCPQFRNIIIVIMRRVFYLA